MKRLHKNAIKRFCPPVIPLGGQSPYGAEGGRFDFSPFALPPRGEKGEPKGVQRPLKQSQTCLNYAECKHFGRSQTKGMYALLITVAAVIGITIYVSCSADDDYDNYSTGNELLTLADKEDHSIIPDSIYLYGVERRTLEHIGSNNN